MKRDIKVKFVDFWPNYDPKEHFLYQALEKKYNVILSDEPDYLFFSVHGNEHLKYQCIKIFYTGENLCPDFNLCDYAIGFEYIDYQDRYLRLPNYYNPKYYNDFKLMEQKFKFKKADLNKKEGFCSFVYSNGNADIIREKIFDMLNNYKKVGSGGKFKNNVGGPVTNKIEFQKKYKFCIAFENSCHPGYTTEKIVQAYASNAIPIYWGDPLISKVFNDKSFININDFATIEDAIDYIKKVDCDDELYLKIMKEKPLLNTEDRIEAKMEELNIFLYNIVEQSKDDAKRFNRVYWGQNYIVEHIKWKNAYDSKMFVRVKKILKKLKRK